MSADEMTGIAGLLLVLSGLLSLILRTAPRRLTGLPALAAMALLAAGFFERWHRYAAAMDASWLEAFPVSTFFESAVFFAFLTLAAGLAVMKRVPSRFFSAALFGGCGALLLLLSLSGIPSGPLLFLPSLKSGWLIAHVALSFAAYAAYAIAAALSLGIIFTKDGERLVPALRRLLADATIVFTVGGLVFGAVWAQQSWGRFWAWDPKETWAFITWCAYMLLLHADWRGRLTGRGLAAWALADFVIVLFTYFGVSFLFAGLHSYISLSEAL